MKLNLTLCCSLKNMFYQMKLSLLKQTIQAFVKAQISIIVVQNRACDQQCGGLVATTFLGSRVG